MELARVVELMSNKQSIKKARKQFIKDLNEDLKASNQLKNVTYGNVDSRKHIYEFQLMINPDSLPRHQQSLLYLKKDVLDSGFQMQRDMNGTISGLSLFINKAFRQNKLYVKCSKSLLKNGRIDISHARVHLDDPRKYNPKEQDGLNFWVQFKVIPKVTIRSKK